jgi:Nif-specific regulatory protein
VALYQIRSLVCFPLRIKDVVLGAVYLDNQHAPRAYRAEDLDFLRAFTNLGAIAIENSRLLGRLREENLYLQRAAGERFRHGNIIGSGPAMERVFRLVEKAADTAFPVLVTGETGTGKEVITKAIHFGGNRRDRPFVAQNCAAIPSELLESEMFGYKRGAFTGADQDKKGLFEIAHGGTLLLDEIGELDLALQAKLLRVLQDGAIRRVGETAERKVNVRIVAATNRDLKEAVERGTFRLDLFYRLNVLTIELPPLRERREDIPLLAQAFLERSSKQMDRHIRGFTTRAVERLTQYLWPGNVRELENAVARAVVFADGDVIDLDSLPTFLIEGQPPPRAAAPTAQGSGAGGAAVARAEALMAEMEAGSASFWEVVKKPFLKRDLSREVVREVVRLGLEKAGWKYSRALRVFGLEDEEYRRFMNFLAKFNLKVDRPPDAF